MRYHNDEMHKEVEKEEVEIEFKKFAIIENISIGNIKGWR